MESRAENEERNRPDSRRNERVPEISGFVYFPSVFVYILCLYFSFICILENERESDFWIWIGRKRGERLSVRGALVESPIHNETQTQSASLISPFYKGSILRVHEDLRIERFVSAITAPAARAFLALCIHRRHISARNGSSCRSCVNVTFLVLLQRNERPSARKTHAASLRCRHGTHRMDVAQPVTAVVRALFLQLNDIGRSGSTVERETSSACKHLQREQTPRLPLQNCKISFRKVVYDGFHLILHPILGSWFPGGDCPFTHN